MSAETQEALIKFVENRLALCAAKAIDYDAFIVTNASLLENSDDENFQKLEVAGTLTFDKISCDKVSVSGKPQIDSVTADEILIASRSGFLGDVKCRKIKVDGGFAPVNFWSRVRIKNIEAEVVALENCEVDVIRCQDAFIGTNCAIEKLFVAGKYEVADDSTVGEIIHV